jgi:hypothetical protein
VAHVHHQLERALLDGAGAVAQGDELEGDGDAARPGGAPDLAEATFAEALVQDVAGDGLGARLKVQ